MLARKCTKGSNLKDIWRWRSWLLSLKSRRCGIFLYQLLERLFYVSCVRVGKKLHWRACPYPLSFFKRWPFCTECKERGIFEPYLIQQKNEEMKKVKLLLRHNFSGHIRTPFPWMEVVNVWFCRETVKLNLNYGCDKSATSFGRELPILFYGWGQVSIIFPFS